MPDERQQRNQRAQKEDHILKIVNAQGVIKVKDLYGKYSVKYQGSAIRTFLGEYLAALEFRGVIVLVNDSTGYFAYSPEEYEKAVKKGDLKER